MPTPAKKPGGSHRMPALFSPNPLAAEHRVLRTHLSPAECIARLEAETAGAAGRADKWVGGEWLLRGAVGCDGFYVRRFRRDFQSVGRPFVSGALETEGSGTRIWLTFAPTIGFRYFSVFATVAIIAFAVFSVATGYIRSTVNINRGEAHLPVPWLIVILVGALVVGPYLLKLTAVSEGPWLLEYLMETLEAHFDGEVKKKVARKDRKR